MMSAVLALDMSGFLENSESWIQWTLLPEPLLQLIAQSAESVMRASISLSLVSRLTALAWANSPMRIMTSRRGLTLEHTPGFSLVAP